ncbi:hypothetical protein [Promicromonospora sp. MEB111]|uniref:hypothetical protein n=1 Tax=Promicromonospora sp. MEB111 TaxID=3040301 RepID=UPI0025516DD6|nr:hypothetical protein [Promicromonospora sp. MEB111]
MRSRQRRVSVFLQVVGLLAWLASAVSSTVLVVHDESRDLRVVLCATIAVSLAVIRLLVPPEVTPLPALSGRRRRSVAAFGRLVVRVCWLLRGLATGAAAWVVTWNADSAAFQPLTAALVAASMTLATVGQLGQHAAGFVTAAEDLRGTGLLNRLGTIVVAAVTAGSAGLVAAFVNWFWDRAGDPVWTLTREDWGLPSFVAGLLTGVTTFLVVATIAGAVGVAMMSVALALGPGNAVGRWLGAHSPVQYARWIDSVHVNVLGFTYSGPAVPTERVARSIYRGVRDSSGALHPVFLRMLSEDVLDAAARLLPAGAQEPWVSLCAVGDHEEIHLEFLPAGAGPDEPREARRLHDFAETAALRRLRTGLPSPLEGLPAEVRCAPRGTPMGAGRWTDLGDCTVGEPRAANGDSLEPDWADVPVRDDLIREVVRHPPGPRRVREQLGLPQVRW